MKLLSTSLILFLSFLAFSPPVSADDRKPNILVILTDDLGINDLSCYGRSDQPTPHLDRLAAEGMRFTNAYCAQPICSPSRAALMTGLAPARLHLTTYLPGRPDASSQMLLHPQINSRLPAEATTIAERLKKAGYATGLIGKWHLGEGLFASPTHRGFDVHYAGQPNTQPSETEGGKGEYDLTAQAEKFIEAHKAGPFFLLLSHNTPHIPLAAKPEWVEKHRSAGAFNPVHAAVIETLDDSVGRLMAKLEAMKLRDDTLVIFTSDNGGLHVHEGADTPATYNAPYRAGKGYLYEGGLRIPLIFRFPGRSQPGLVTDAPVVNTDWVPTWLELAGVPVPEPLDGVSVVTLLTSGGGSDASVSARPLYWHFPHYSNQGGRPGGAVREGDWKLIEDYEMGTMELYNLARDAGETTDLSSKEPARVAELRGKLAAWREAIDAQENSPNPDFQPALWQRLYRETDTSRLTVPQGASAAELRRELDGWRAGMNRVIQSPDPRKNPEAAGRLSTPAGLVILHARDAAVHGQTLRYEPQPQKETLGYWTNPQDWASWKFEVTHGGAYSIHVLQGCGKGHGGAEVELIVDESQPVRFAVGETGHFQNFISREVGKIQLEQGTHTLEVRPRTKPGAAVVDLRRVTLIRSE